MRLGIIFILFSIFIIPAHADQWDSFHPEVVTKMTCRAEPITEVLHGAKSSRSCFSAEAKAERSDKELGNWEMSLGCFEGPHGARKAAETCGKWIDEADKRIRKAKGLK